jgi:hypothetical protein
MTRYWRPAIGDQKFAAVPGRRIQPKTLIDEKSVIGKRNQPAPTVRRDDGRFLIADMRCLIP